MNDLDQFIDEVLFKQSDQYKLIYEAVAQQINQDKGNLGNASELIAYANLCVKITNLLGKQNVQCDPTIQDAMIEANTFIPANSSIDAKALDLEANKHADYLFNKFFYMREYFGKDLKPIKAELKFIGKEEAGKSSGDISIKFIYNDPKNPSKIFKASLKRNNKIIYQSGKFSTDQDTLNALSGDYSTGLPNQVDTDLIKFSGGGLIKIFKLFGFPRDAQIEDEIKKKNQDLNIIYRRFNSTKIVKTEKDISELKTNFKIKTKDRNILITNYMKKFSVYLDKELKNKQNRKQKIENLFNLFYNLLTRGDEDVAVFSDMYSFRETNYENNLERNYNVLFTPLINVYIGHIKKMSIETGFQNRSPYINFLIDETQKFENTLLNKDKTLNSNIKNLLVELREKVNKSLAEEEKFKSSEKTDQKFETINGMLSIFGINKKYFSGDSSKSLYLLFNDLVNSANSIISSIDNKKIFKIRYQVFTKELEDKQKEKEKKEEQQESGRAEVSVLSGGFNKFIKFLNNLYSLQNNDIQEVQSILSLIEKLLLEAKKEKTEDSEPDFDLKESLNKLITEALNEKEFNKVLNKISSASADGFISALPSNKTSNSIAVRFDDEEKINSGIKKIKSKLQSSGYELDSKRVLKFDQDRDTIDVLKNGEVVGRLFFRADIKERQGLAYEHIIGCVLTNKITDQLKNRIDLPPDASLEDVKQKLNSEKFKHLYDSAKKAAPIIIKKVGDIESAESVGSTNNKADFILTTVDGKTIGLSAKYAAGEKDNEYKMNKVLGFGTEDESLVYNPKAVPWWVVGRQTFLEKLKQQTGAFKDKNYDPDYETLEAPAWMKSAKEKHPDIYKETMEEVYGQIRNVLTRNLRRMKFKDLVSFVMEADLGKEEERGNYDKFIKVVDGPSGLSVTEVGMDSDGSGIDPKQLNPEEVVVQDRSDIIIKIPGFNELKINSVKFKSDMLSSKAGDLKIKTR